MFVMSQCDILNLVEEFFHNSYIMRKLFI